MPEQNQIQAQLDYNDRAVALTIAGSDSGGGAGIQADLKTFSFHGVHGTSAITSATAQNSVGVQGAQDMNPTFVAEQIRSIATDFDIDAVKTGMLANREIINQIASSIEQHSLTNIVVDPVMFAESGDRLLEEDALSDLQDNLLPMADVITPNIPEGEVLLEQSIESYDDMEEAAHELSKQYDAAIVLKGGHFDGDATDVLAMQDKVWNTRGPRLDRNSSHGSGCAFSSAIAANLSIGRTISESVEYAKNFITEAIRWGANEGSGSGCVEPNWGKFRAQEIRELQMALSNALEELRHASFGRFIPEVQSNFAFALDNANFLKDVVGFPGRIIKLEDDFRVLEQPVAGATDHMGRLVLAAMEVNPQIRSALNIRFSENIVQAARVAGLNVIEHDRDAEPQEVRSEEGQSIRYAVERSCNRNEGRVPDVIFDRGSVGKEAMVRILGTDPSNVAQKFHRISRNHRDDRSQT